MNFFVQTHIVQQVETLDDIIQKYKYNRQNKMSKFSKQNVQKI